MDQQPQIDDQDVWKNPTPTHPNLHPSSPLLQSLSHLDATLRCPICSDLYTAPVMVVPCGHSFCSHCLVTNVKYQVERTGTKREATCPTCMVVKLDAHKVVGGASAEVVGNRVLEESVRAFRAVRGPLVDRLGMDSSAAEGVGGNGGKKKNGGSIGSSRKNGGTTRAAKRSPGKRKSAGDEDNGSDSDADVRSSVDAVKASGRRRDGKRARRAAAAAATDRLKQGDAQDDEEYEEEEKKEEEEADYANNEEEDGDSDVEFVEPPGGAAAAASAASASSTAASAHAATKSKWSHLDRTQPLPAPHLLKIKKSHLIAKLTEFGLSTKGTDEQRKQRYKSFWSLYNSQCSSQHPLSVEEMVQQIHRQERAVAEEQSKSMMNGTQSYAKHWKNITAKLDKRGAADAEDGPGDSNNSIITSGNAKFDGMMEEGFKKMIAEARARGLDGKKAKEAKMERGGGSVEETIEEGENDVDRSTSIDAAGVVGGGGGKDDTGNENSAVNRAKEGAEDDKDDDDNEEEEDGKPRAKDDNDDDSHAEDNEDGSGSDNDDDDDGDDGDLPMTDNGASSSGPKDGEGSSGNGGNNADDAEGDDDDDASVEEVDSNGTPIRTVSAANSSDIDDCRSSGGGSGRSSPSSPNARADSSSASSAARGNQPSLFEGAAEDQRRRQERHEQQDAPSASTRSQRVSDAPSIIGPWSCDVCTFRNMNRRHSRALCEMCNAPRPSPKKRQRGGGGDVIDIDC